MSLEQIIEGLKAKAPPNSEVVEVKIPNPDPTFPLTECDLPAGMPLTNRLDKMTKEQGRWAIANGDAWKAYLKEQRASGVDVDIVEHKPPEAYQPPTPAEKYQAICDILEKVWLGLTDNMKRKSLRAEQIPDWVSTLEWAIKALPVGYERQGEIFQSELAEYQPDYR